MHRYQGGIHGKTKPEVALNDPRETKIWADHFGVPVDRLRAAVAEVGTNPKDIRAQLAKMELHLAPRRLFYSLVPSPMPKDQDVPPRLRVYVTYASGRIRPLREKFLSSGDAERFIARYYPDLVGKTAEGSQTPRNS